MVKIMETPIKMDDLGVPLFLETPIFSKWKESFMWKKTPTNKSGEHVFIVFFRIESMMEL